MSPYETWLNAAVTKRIGDDAWSQTRAFKVHLLITKDEEGTYSAVALNLPGAGSCGDTEEDAISNAREAVLGVVASYLDAGEKIPWKDTWDADIPFGAEQKWIFVYA
jgi:predicted RNase H-like HicB family nuclease